MADIIPSYARNLLKEAAFSYVDAFENVALVSAHRGRNPRRYSKQDTADSLFPPA